MKESENFPVNIIRIDSSADPVHPREYYYLPTIENIATRLHGAKVFTKLDVQSEFWHRRGSGRRFDLLDNVQRYVRWGRLSFGVSSSPELFQWKKVPVSSLERCEQQGVKLNTDKVNLRRKLHFFGHLATDKGLGDDPAEARAIDDTPA